MQNECSTYFILHEALDVIPNTLVGCQFDRGVKNHNILLSVPVTIYLQWYTCIVLDELKNLKE